MAKFDKTKAEILAMYLEMGETRSIPKLLKHLQENTRNHPKQKTLYEWFHRGDWKQKALEHDKQVERVAKKAAAERQGKEIFDTVARLEGVMQTGVEHCEAMLESIDPTSEKGYSDFRAAVSAICQIIEKIETLKGGAADRDAKEKERTMDDRKQEASASAHEKLAMLSPKIADFHERKLRAEARVANGV